MAMGALKTRLPPSVAVTRFAAVRSSVFSPSAQAPVSIRQPRSGRTSTRRRPPGCIPMIAASAPATRVFPSSCTANLSPSLSSSSP